MNKDQLEALIKFMEDNPQLATAKSSQYSDLWIEVSTIVNSVPNGGFKDVESLKRSWKDMIINAEAAFTSYMNRTSKTINENYRRILALTKDSTVVDDENDQEEYKQRFPALAKLKAEQSQQPTVQSPMFIDLTSGPSASTRAVRKSCSGTPSTSEAGLVTQPTKRQGKSLGNPSGRSTFPNVPPPSVRGSDFINNFNNAGAQHVATIVQQIIVLSQDIQKFFKDCFENFGNQLVQNLSKMISEELVKAVINMQAAQSSKADDDFEASLPKVFFNKLLEDATEKVEKEEELDEENYPVDYLDEYDDMDCENNGGYGSNNQYDAENDGFENHFNGAYSN